MSVFGWSYPAGAANDPSAPYNQTDEPIMLNEGKTLPGYGDSRDGYNGKDGDLNTEGQIVIHEAWFFPELVRCELTCYATISPSDDESKDASPYVGDMPFEAEWTGDEWIITTGKFTIEFATEAEEAEQALDELIKAIDEDETVKSFALEVGGLNRMLDAWYDGTEEDYG